MKKKLISAFIILSLLLSMASCGGSNTEIPDDTNENIKDEASSGEGNGDSNETDKDSENDGDGQQEADEDADEGTLDGTKEEEEGTYVYSVNSKKYHLPTCRYVEKMKNESKVVFEGTIEDITLLGYIPCFTCKPDPNYDYSSNSDTSSNNNGFVDVDSGYTYALNTSSMKLHYSGCSALKNTKDENKLYSNETRAELVKQGYEACGTCNP